MRLRRRPLVLALATALTLVAMPVGAATPAFEFDINMSSSSIEVTVDFEPVPPGFAWGSFEASGVPEELVGLFPASDVDDRGRPLPEAEPLLLSLKRVDWGVYRDSIDVDDGEWAVVAWPLIDGFDPDDHPGAARTEIVLVGTSDVILGATQAEARASDGLPLWTWIVLGGVIVSGLALGAVRLNAGRERVESDSR